jgi:hypothetical protein
VPLIDFTTSFVGGPSFYTGTGVTDLVPSQFPVALNGRPYLLDLRSNRFSHQFEQRVRDQSDISTAPGEASINPQGLWRRGSKSWHLGAGQLYADDADAQDYRFSKSKGVDVWTKGQLSLLNDTKLSFPTDATNLMTCTVISSGGTEYFYVADGKFVRFSTTPFDNAKTATISTVSGDGTTMTYTTTATHGFTAGHTVTVTGVSPSGYNVTKAVIATTPSTTQFTVAGSESGAYVSGGAVTVWPWTTSISMRWAVCMITQ